MTVDEQSRYKFCAGMHCCICGKMYAVTADMALGPNGVYCIDCLREAVEIEDTDEARVFLGIYSQDNGIEKGVMV